MATDVRRSLYTSDKVTLTTYGATKHGLMLVSYLGATQLAGCTLTLKILGLEIEDGAQVARPVLKQRAEVGWKIVCCVAIGRPSVMRLARRISTKNPEAQKHTVAWIFCAEHVANTLVYRLATIFPWMAEVCKRDERSSQHGRRREQIRAYLEGIPGASKMTGILKRKVALREPRDIRLCSAHLISVGLVCNMQQPRDATM